MVQIVVRIIHHCNSACRAEYNSQGIYPTLLIILVAVNKSQVDRYTTYQAGNTLNFAANPVVTGNVTIGSIQTSTQATSTTHYRLNVLKDSSDPSLGRSSVDAKEKGIQ